MEDALRQSSRPGVQRKGHVYNPRESIVEEREQSKKAREEIQRNHREKKLRRKEGKPSEEKEKEKLCEEEVQKLREKRFQKSCEKKSQKLRKEKLREAKEEAKKQEKNPQLPADLKAKIGERRYPTSDEIEDPVKTFPKWHPDLAAQPDQTSPALPPKSPKLPVTSRPSVLPKPANEKKYSVREEFLSEISESPSSDSDSNDDELLVDEDDLLDNHDQSEERFSNPRKHFENLAELEQSIYKRSALHRYCSLHLLARSATTSSEISSGLEQDSIRSFLHMSMLNDEAMRALSRITESTIGVHWAIFRDTLINVQANIEAMKEYGFCQEHFSIVSLDPARSNVARLLPIRTDLVHELVQDIQNVFQNYLLCVTHGSDEPPLTRESHVQMCLNILSEAGFLPTKATPVHIIWQLTAYVLDLGVLSYAGAHVERFDTTYLGAGRTELPIVLPFLRLDLELGELHFSSGADKLLSLRQRRLQCLDAFLGNRGVWVFEIPDSSSTSVMTDADRLLLSASITAFSDIWGPTWAAVSHENQSEIRSYQVGNGYIVPWPSPHDDGEGPLLDGNGHEVSSHWLSHKEMNTIDIEKCQETFARKHFLATDTLLIGAIAGLYVNEKCQASEGYLKDFFRRKNAMRSPRTSRSKRYVDGYTLQVSVGGMSLAKFGGQVTYKRRAGFNMKDALVERWRNKERNISDLEAFSGVEFSLCTRNARRRRLWQILRSQTMCDFLRANSFEWKSAECEAAYYEALADPRKFRRRFQKLWARKEYCNNVGDAISMCLDALYETGVDEDTDEMSALWVQRRATNEQALRIYSETGSCAASGSDTASDTGDESLSEETNCIVPTYEEWVISFFRSEHTWNPFLSDSTESLTLAIAEKTCLCMSDQPRYGWERCCLAPRERCNGSTYVYSPGYPVLETSLLINEDMLRKEGLHHKKRRHGEQDNSKRWWDTKDMKKGSEFSLGDRGSLRLYLKGEEQLIMHWQPGFSKTIKSFVEDDLNARSRGTRRSPHHQEYIRGDWCVQPIPILLLSNSTKISSSREDERAAGLEHIRRLEIEARTTSRRVH